VGDDWVAIAALADRRYAPITAKSSVVKLIGKKISQTFWAKLTKKLFRVAAQSQKNHPAEKIFGQYPSMN
jgi:hypothetical protein